MATQNNPKHLIISSFFVILMSMAGCAGSSSPANTSSIATSTTSSSSQSSSESSSESTPISSSSGSEVTVDVSKIVLHYHNESGNYTNWCFWIWEEGAEGALFLFDGTDAYGAYGSYAASTWATKTKLSIIVRQKLTWEGQTEDRTFRFADFPLDSNNDLHVYILEGEAELFTNAQDALGDRVTYAAFTSWTSIKVETTAAFANYELLVDGTAVKTGTGGNSPQIINLDADADLAKSYAIAVRFKLTDTKTKNRVVASNALYDTAKFNDNYVYTGDDLGVTYTAASSTFKLWAPTSSNVMLRIYGVGTPSSVSGNILNDQNFEYQMVRGAKGVWQYVYTGNLNNKYYTYVVTNSAGTNEVVDPYAHGAGVNGMRGMIVNFDATNPTDWDKIQYSDISAPNDLTVYELHVRDLTSDTSWNGTEAKRGKYLGLSESGTTYTEGDVTVSTGFDSIKELGVNAVQLLPIFDSANNELDPSYNWGYNPLNYNVLDGAYSSAPLRGDVRIREFKEMVKAYADSGIRIIMDVVYNHVSAASSSNFTYIVPGYYFRYNADGSYSNGSGCGNEVASERAMARKFIIDSVCFWASEYNIKGFRFDLMGLLDTTTMNYAKAALAAIDPDIVVYGEPWAAAGTSSQATMSTTGNVYSSLVGVGGFNDNGRNGIRGENSWSGNQYGWMQKGEADNQSNTSLINRVKGMLAGMNGSYYDYANWDPAKTINYASCHDNLTLYDQLSGTVDATDVAKASVAINSTVLFSEGIPFIQGGEEIMRSKLASEADTADTYYTINSQHISHNSYKSGDATNSYKWANKITYKSYFDKYAEAILLRKAHPSFRLSDKNLIATASESGLTKNMGIWEGDLAYSTIGAWYTAEEKAIYVFINAREVVTTGTKQSLITFGGDVHVIFDSSGSKKIGTLLTDTVTLEPYSVLVVQR